MPKVKIKSKVTFRSVFLWEAIVAQWLVLVCQPCGEGLNSDGLVQSHLLQGGTYLAAAYIKNLVFNLIILRPSIS